MESDLEKYSFACCFALKRIELCKGLLFFSTFFLQCFLVMDPFDCKKYRKC